MSEYIRIYVNGKHIRSTGKEKWYRDSILQSLGIIPGKSEEEIGRFMREQAWKFIMEDDATLTQSFMVEHVHLTCNKRTKSIRHCEMSDYYLTKEADGYIYLNSTRNDKILLIPNGWCITFISWDDGKPRVALRCNTTEEKDAFLEKIHKPDSGWVPEELESLSCHPDKNYMLPY